MDSTNALNLGAYYLGEKDEGSKSNCGVWNASNKIIHWLVTKGQFDNLITFFDVHMKEKMVQLYILLDHEIYLKKWHNKKDLYLSPILVWLVLGMFCGCPS
jgi:hypothetical protein